MVVMSYIFLFASLMELIFGHIKEATGTNFDDSFAVFDGSLWKMEYDYLHCVGACVYMDPSKLKFFRLPKLPQTPLNTPRQTEMQIIMRNDCKGEQCCEADYCTPYSAGHLTSTHTYGYGSYRFLAMLAKNQGKQSRENSKH